MKGTYLVGTVFWILFAVILLAILLLCIFVQPRFGFITQIGESALVQQESIDLSGIEAIELDASHHTVNVRLTQQPTAQLYLYDRAGQKATVEKNGDTLTISHQPKGFSLFNLFSFGNRSIELELPQSYEQALSLKTGYGNITLQDVPALKAFHADTNSGNVTIKNALAVSGPVTLRTHSGNIRAEGDISSASAELKVSSGNVRIQSLRCTESADLQAQSGTVTVNGELSAPQAAASAASGRVSLGALTSQMYSLSTASGTVEANSISGSGEVEVTSGNIRLGLTDQARDTRCNSTSGNIRISVPETLSFSFEASTTSGSIRTEIPLSDNKGNKSYLSGTFGSEPRARIVCDVTSGNITLSPAE